MSALTNVRPFSNGTEADVWLAANCERCSLNGYGRSGRAVCPMEEAIAMGRITGTVPSDLAAAYGATIRGDYCDMPHECAKFAPPATCEFIPKPKSRRRAQCGRPATDTYVVKGRTRAVCAECKAKCVEMDAEDPAVRA